MDGRAGEADMPMILRDDTSLTAVCRDSDGPQTDQTSR
jgi:hypothetical protein